MRRVQLKYLNNRLFKAFTLISAIFLILTLGAIVVFIAVHAFPALQSLGIFDLFFSNNWVPEEDKFGSLAFIYGTMSVTLLTLLIAAPVSIILAIFLAEILPVKYRGGITSIVDILAGLPSVVYGYLGITILLPFLRDVTGHTMVDGILAGALILSLMVLPTIARISQDAISSVPKEYKLAAYALGATKFQTIWSVTLPVAKNGIISAITLGMVRAMGETMAIAMVIGNSPQIAAKLFAPIATLTTNILIQIPSVFYDSMWSNVLYAQALLLLVIALFLVVALWFIRREQAQ